jgi:hypothetical protein
VKTRAATGVLQRECARLAALLDAACGPLSDPDTGRALNTLWDENRDEAAIRMLRKRGAPEENTAEIRLMTRACAAAELRGREQIERKRRRLRKQAARIFRRLHRPLSERRPVRVGGRGRGRAPRQRVTLRRSRARSPGSEPPPATPSSPEAAR